MTSSSLVGARVKIERAKKHLAELTAAARVFLETMPYQIALEDEPGTGDRVYRVRVKQPIPAEWSGILGDVIHNLRAALDLAVWQMVLANGGVPNERTAFPISSSHKDFAANGVQRLAGASSRAFRLIKRLRPYKGGNESLWRLHRLDIVDKHRTILLVGSAYRSVQITFKMKVPWQDTVVESSPVALRPADRLFPLTDNVEVFRIKAAARQQENVLNHDYKFAFEIAFGDGEVLSGEPVFPTLQTLVEYVTRIIDIVERIVS